MRSNARRNAFLWVCVAPAVVLFILFIVIPTFNVFRLSLFEKGAYNPQETFIGFENFKKLLASP